MPEGQKTSIQVTTDGLKLQGLPQDDYLGTILWAVLAFVILGMIALIKWGPKLLEFFRNGNGKKSDSNGNGSVKKAVTDAIQDTRLTAIEDNHKELRLDIREIQLGQNTIIEKQGAIGAKIDIILAKVG